jgi:hypothetical protein
MRADWKMTRVRMKVSTIRTGLIVLVFVFVWVY